MLRMYIRAPFLFFITMAFLMTGAWLCGEDSAVDRYSQQATDVSQKRFKQKSWSGGKQSAIMQKSFPFKQWDSHYSSLGSKRSNISTKETKDKELFKADTVEFSKKDMMNISKWDGRLAKLEDRAQVSTGKTLGQLEDKRMYESLMQSSKNYSDTGKTLSLRDINRFQFRQNRSSASVPVSEAGVKPE